MLSQVKDEEPSEEAVNEELYSRQLYVLGAAAQRRLQKSRVLISGELSGLAAELCKNVVLAGVSSLTLNDDTPASAKDLSSAGFLIKEKDVEKNVARSALFLEELREMNSNVNVQKLAGEPDYRGFDVVVLVNASREKIQMISTLLRSERTLQTRLIVTGMYGLFSYCFSDFGSSWEVSDVDGEIVKSGLILGATSQGPQTFEIVTELPHRLSDGDWVKFTTEGLNGPFKVATVRTSNGKLDECRFKVSLTSPLSSLPNMPYAFDGAYFEQVKMPVVVTSHEPFGRSIENPRLVNNSYEDDTRPMRLFHLLRALWTFMESNRRFPDGDKEEADVQSVVGDAAERLTLSREQHTELCGLTKACSGSLSPIASFMGGVAGQEVLKACTGKFMPLDQWLLFAAPECLGFAKPSFYPFVKGVRNGRYEGQVRVFGHENQKKLGALKVLVVGAGALGCEILKNLALMGVSTASEGGITYVTDPDSIEISNLNRQFLFRPSTVGKNKAVCAVAAAKKMNPDFQAQAFQERVSAEATGSFTDSFWDSLDIVINALDNVPSRMYVDSQCVYYGKPLLESGTLGTKANTLPVIPNLTESYGSDPVKDYDATPEIPACTLHAYPNLFEHVLTWARDAVFEKEFVVDPTEAKTFIDAFRQGQVQQLVQTMLRQPNSIAAKLRAARGVIVGLLPTDNAEGIFPFTSATHGSGSLLGSVVDSSNQPFTLKECVLLARLKFQELFSYKIQALLEQHPVDSKDGDQPFWSGKRRMPQPAQFDLDEPSHMLFLISMAKLLAHVHNVGENERIDADFVRHTIHQQQKSVPIPSTWPKVSGATENNKVEESEWRGDVGKMEKVMASSPGLVIEPCRFDKDDDVHIDLVWSVAVIRAKNYRIPIMDRMEAKRVVGRIIPAIATSTAAATGLVALELYKCALAGGNKQIDIHRACNFNLAVNSFASFEPKPCVTTYKFGATECNLWTVISISGDLTIEELIEAVSCRFRGFEISSLTTTGEVTLYNDLFSMDDESLRSTRISDLYRKIVGKEPPEVFIPLAVDGDFEDGSFDDFVVPPVRLRWKEKV